MSTLVKTLRLLADGTRLRLLRLLESEELSVAELQEILGMGQSRISAHLAQLKQAGLVSQRLAGKNIYYGFPSQREALGPQRDATAEKVRAIINASADDIPQAAADQSALKLALKKRSDRARTYFDQLAGKFGRSYCPGRSWEGVAHLLFALLPPVVVADLGAGEGTLAQLMAKRARHVIAVDNSENMVQFGSELAARQGFQNLDYRLGDIEEPPIENESVDVAVLSQALHHAAAPTRALAAAHRILQRGGRVVILDLLAHQFEQARELYADSWLGFAEAELHGLLEQNGFAQVEISVVAREAQPPHFQTIFATAIKA